MIYGLGIGILLLAIAGGVMAIKETNAYRMREADDSECAVLMEENQKLLDEWRRLIEEAKQEQKDYWNNYWKNEKRG